MLRQRILGIFLVLAFLFSLGFGGTARAADVNTDQLKQMFDDHGAPGNWSYLKSQVDNNLIGWEESYIMRAYLYMYKATGDKQYLDNFIDHADSVLARRDSVRGVTDYRGLSLPAWRCGVYTNYEKYYIYAVLTGLTAAPLAEFSTIVNNNNLTEYSDKADRYVQAAKNAIGVLDMSDTPEYTDWNSKWYEDENSMHLDQPLNKNTAVGSAYLDIYEATGDETYLNKAEKIANYFKKNLRVNYSVDGYIWNYYPNDPTYGDIIEDTNHSYTVVHFVKKAYRQGIFNDGDMEKFANTASEVLIKYDGTIANRLDGSGSIPQQGQIALWLVFDRWDESGKIFETSYNIISNKSRLYAPEVLGLALLNYSFNQDGPANPSEPPEDSEPGEPEPSPGEPDPSTGDNLITNGDFSSGTEGWVNSGSTAGIDSDSSGNQYLTNSYSWDFYQELTLEPGTYVFNADVRKGTADKGARVPVQIFHKDGSYTVPYAFKYDASTSGWEPMPEMTVQVPDTATKVRIYPSVDTGSSGTYHFDNISLTPAGEPGDPETETDTQKPEVTLTYPEEESKLNNTVSLTADASDNEEVEQVTFEWSTDADNWTSIGKASLDSGSASNGTWSLDWNVSDIENDTYYVRASARDTSNNSAVSQYITCEINPDIQPPQVSITEPIAGTFLNNTTELKASVSDNTQVDRVTFEWSTGNQNWTSIGEASLDSGSTSDGTWVLDWDVSGMDNGTCYVRAVAQDTAGNSAFSEPTAFEVDNRVNLITNGDFSSGAEGWVNSGRSAEIDSDSSGNRYLTNSYSWEFYQELALAPGTYVFNADARKGTADKSARIPVQIFHEDGSYTVPYAFKYDASASAWESMPEMTLQVPETATKVRIYPSVDTGSSGTYHFDNISLTPIPDTQPPQVNTTSPEDGSKIKDTTTLKASVSDNTQVDQVTFEWSADNKNWTSIGEASLDSGSASDGTWVLDWDVSGMDNGTFYVRAVAQDAAGNSAASEPTACEVDNRVNVITNGDFSSGAEGWVNSGSSAEINSDSSGNRYLTNSYSWEFYQELTLEPGTYVFNADVRKGTADKSARIPVQIFHEDGSYTVPYAFKYDASATGWESMPEMTLQVPETATKVRIYPSVDTGSYGTYHFDNISLTPSN